VATDYGGAYGSQPWPGAEPYPGRPGPGRGTPGPAVSRPGPGGSGPDAAGSRPTRAERVLGPGTGGPGWGGPGGAPHQTPHSAPGTPERGRKRALLLAVAALAGVGLAGSVLGIAWQMLPRHFNAAQRRQITDWEYGQRWRTLAAGSIFPGSVRYVPPSALSDDPSLRLSARRIGIARQASCTAAVDPAAARALNSDGCTAVLRATYVDGTGTYLVTVGAAVMPGTSQAAAAARSISGAASTGTLGPSVRTVSFKNTPAASFTDQRRQLSGAVAAGSYVVLYAVGYADDRPKEPVAGDGYTDNEMTSAGSSVAGAVLAVLAAPVPAPHCPGTPGC
jgi:hypothetical protein